MTSKERLAALEAQQQGHGREHRALERLWASRLEAIDFRLRNIEEAVNGWRGSSSGSNGRRRFSSRDLGVAGGSIAISTALWWLVDLLRAAGGE